MRIYIGESKDPGIRNDEFVIKPELYQAYEKTEAIAFFGSDAAVRRLCNDQWFIFPTRIICLTTLGEWPQAPHFKWATRFCWVADKDYRVGRDTQYPACLPTEVIGGHTEGRTLHLFIRNGTTQKYVYAGEMGPTHAMGYAGENNYGYAYFDLSPALPSAVWTELGGLQIGDADHASVDAALDRLRAGTTWEERFGVLKRLVEYWHGPIHASDGMAEAELAGIQMPTVLRDWYRWAGNRGEILSGQNFLSEPRKLEIDDGLLQFYVENQGVYQWATLADGDDPPVFGRYPPRTFGVPSIEELSQPGLHDWEPEGVSLSEHLILTCLFEAVMCSKYGASAASADYNVLAEIANTIPPIAIGEWRWLDGARFHARNGAFMITSQNYEDWGESARSVWIGAKNEHSLQFLKRHVNESWEHVAF